LGTGKIYDNNFESPLEVKQGSIRYNAKFNWDPLLIEPNLSAPQISEE
jgi:hypothetical protein